MVKKDLRFDGKDILHLMEKHPKLYRDVSNFIARKKEYRLVINLPNWLKKQLKRESEQSGLSMNEIIRIAVVDYLSKKE